MACQICYNELPAEKMRKLDCGCSYCKICLYIWITSQLDHYTTLNFIIRCPNFNPPHILNEDEVKTSLSDSEFNHYQLLLIRRNLQQQDDYRICPAKKCNYIGWIDKNCTNQLVCGFCETQWTDPSLKKDSLLFLKNCYKFMMGKEIDFLSEVWKDIWTKKCPKCSYAIEKNGGCNHMKCGNCQYEFCWRCMNEYNNHIQKMCYDYFSIIFLIFFSWMMAFFAIKSIYSSDILREIIILILNLFGCISMITMTSSALALHIALIYIFAFKKINQSRLILFGLMIMLLFYDAFLIWLFYSLEENERSIAIFSFLSAGCSSLSIYIAIIVLYRKI